MLTVPFNDLRRHEAGRRDAIAAAMARVLDRGQFILGDEVRRFEEEFATYCGAAYGVGVASGTEALCIALKSLGVGPGDEVVTAPNTCVPTVAGIAMTGARPTLVDVDPVSRTLDPSRLEAALTPRTKAVVPVHLYGQPADMPAIMEVAAARGIAVVEDAAQGHGAAVGGRRVGALGTLACFSFYPTKNLGALGDGGLVTTSDPLLAERARLFRNYGQRERHVSELAGINSRLDELQAAVLHAKLGYLERGNARRRTIAERYCRQLTGGALRLPRAAPNSEPVYHLFVVEVAERNAFRAACAARGVETAVHYPVPIHLQPAYGWLGYRPGDFPVAEALCRSVVSLPVYPELTDAEVELVVDAVRAAA